MKNNTILGKQINSRKVMFILYILPLLIFICYQLSDSYFKSYKPGSNYPLLDNMQKSVDKAESLSGVKISEIIMFDGNEIKNADVIHTYKGPIIRFNRKFADELNVSDLTQVLLHEIGHYENTMDF